MTTKTATSVALVFAAALILLSWVVGFRAGNVWPALIGVLIGAGLSAVLVRWMNGRRS
jgi:hypothetical protein